MRVRKSPAPLGSPSLASGWAPPRCSASSPHIAPAFDSPHLHKITSSRRLRLYFMRVLMVVDQKCFTNPKAALNGRSFGFCISMRRCPARGERRRAERRGRFPHLHHLTKRLRTMRSLLYFGEAATLAAPLSSNDSWDTSCRSRCTSHHPVCRSSVRRNHIHLDSY